MDNNETTEVQQLLDLISKTESRLNHFKECLNVQGVDSMETRLSASYTLVPLNLIVEILNED